MTSTVSSEGSNMAAQGHSGSEHEQVAVSRQSSGVDPAEYEVAAQLIKHSLGQRESRKGNLENTTLDRREPMDEITGREGSMGDGNSDMEGQQDDRRSSSQDRLVDAQYSPLNVPPTNGQRCR